MTTYTNKKQPKSVRLTGKLIIDVRGTPIEVSSNFTIQTDLAFSGMTLPEQETVHNAYLTALQTSANIKFITELSAEEIKSKNIPSKPTQLDLMLEDLKKPSELDLVEAAVKEDTAKETATQAALSILGYTG